MKDFKGDWMESIEMMFKIQEHSTSVGEPLEMLIGRLSVVRDRINHKIYTLKMKLETGE